jgi:phage terminase large subunit
MKISYKERLESLKNIDKYIELYHIPCAESCIDFINRFVMTYDPRLKIDKILPLELFPKQEEFIRWLWNLYIGGKSAAVDKCRDVGASWCFIAFSIWLLLFQKDVAVGFYSYKADAVDKRGEMDSLMEKARFILDHLPNEMKNDIIPGFMLIKKENSSISGLSGERPSGGRKSIIFCDESAFYEHPEIVESGLVEYSNCIIDISTHSGTNTLFYNKVTSGSIPVFVFEWWDNPLHTQKWYDEKKLKAEKQGTMHIFEMNINRNPQASIQNVVVQATWIKAAIQHNIIEHGARVLGFDVADDGTDMKSNVLVDGNDIQYMEVWYDGDINDAAERTFNNAIKLKANLIKYDAIGVGAGAKIRLRQLIEGTGSHIKLIGWNAGGKVMRPEESDFNDIKNNILFENAKSQAYWKVREEFINTFRYVNKKECDVSKIIHISDKIKTDPIFNKFINQLSQPLHKLSTSGRIQIDKKAGRKSPDLAEAYIIARCEAEEEWINWTIL